VPRQVRFEQIKGGGATSSIVKGTLTVGVDVLPPLPKDSGDRNRTSPFAFTGNRFEFRAVGSNQSIAGPLVAMNTIVAESIDYCATRLEDATKDNPEALNGAIQALLTDITNECSSIIFNGNNYASEWHEEAANRGLLNLRTTVDALPYLMSEPVVQLFEGYGVLSARELESRLETYLEQYCMTVRVEANLTVEIAKTMILPTAVRYQGALASTAASIQAAGLEANTSALEEVHVLVYELQERLAFLEAAMAAGDDADHCRDATIPAMAAVRESADALENVVADDLWPLPTYQEMLFIR